MRCRRRLPTRQLAVWALSVGSLALARAQEAAPRPPGADHGALAFLPLEEGAEWVYRSKTHRVEGLPPTASLVRRSVLGSYRDGEAVVWLGRTVDCEVRIEHWQTAPSGLIVRQGVERLGIAAADADRVDWRPLAAPVGAVSEWDWDVPPDDNARAAGADRVHWVANVVAFGEPVTVPAGTFEAMHVHAVASPGTDEHSLWIARGVGIVREEVRSGASTAVRELEHFVPGIDTSPARSALLQMLPPDCLWSVRGAATVRWLDDGVESLALPGRFALLDVGEARRCAFVGGEYALAFDAAAPADWLALIDRLPPVDTPSADTLARLCVRLLAHQRGFHIDSFGPMVGAGRQWRSARTAEVHGWGRSRLRPPRAEITFPTIDTQGKVTEARLLLDLSEDRGARIELTLGPR